MDSLVSEILDYYEKRGLAYPNLQEALNWAHTEMGEVYEIIMSWEPKWIRNNPEDHPAQSKESLAYELGDVIMMLIMAGLAEGVDPINALKNKMKRKLEKSVSGD